MLKVCKKILSKITIKKIIFPQIYCVSPRLIRNPWAFIPLFFIFFLYNIVCLSIYFIALFLIFCALFLVEKLKKIMKQ
jgi:hypothetical protein